MSLRLRLLLILAPLFVVGLAAADVGTYLALQSSLLQQARDQLFTAHIALENELVAGSGRSDGGAPPGAGPFQYLGAFVEILDPSGRVVAGPEVFPPGAYPSDTRPALPAQLPAYKTYLTVSGSGSFKEYLVYVDNSDRIPGSTIVAAIPLDSVNATLGNLLLFELAISGGITLVVVVATWLMVRRGLRPLERMGATARSIAASDLSRRVTPSTERTEVGRLGLALNTMLTQLESAFRQRAASEERLRHFVSDASHELRTPLTSMRGYAELLRRNPDVNSRDVKVALRRIEEETERMGVLVDDLLLLARLDQGRPLVREPFDLATLVRDASADARAVDRQRDIRESVTAPVTVVGDEMRLRQAVGNLLRNALVHTPPGTPVEVSLNGTNDRAVLQVIDHGSGIPAQERGRVFERFVRADPARSRDQGGSGLGLSIAAAVVEAHQGRISIEDTPGGGATFRIELPRAPAA